MASHDEFRRQRQAPTTEGVQAQMRMGMVLAELVTAVEREPVPAVNLPAKQCERDWASTADGDVAQSIDFDSGHDGVLALDGPHGAGAAGRR